MRRRVVAIPVVLLTVGMIWVLWSRIPSEMASLDRSSISINTRGAEGVTYEYIRDYTEDMNRLVDSLVPEAEAITARVSSGSGNVRISLRDIADRDRSQMEIAEELSKAVRSKTMARAFVQRRSSVRWPPEPDARAVRAAGDQSREAPAGTARIYGEGLREPRFPDGRRRSEVQQARGPHHDQPRQGRSDGRQYARHSRNPSVRPQRPAHGLFLHERQAVRSTLGEINRRRRSKPTDLKSIYVRSEAGEMVQLDNLVSLQEAVAPPQLVQSLQPFRFGYRIGRTGRGEDDRAGPRRDGPHRARDARRHVPHGAGRRFEGVPRELVEPDVRFRAGHRADLSDPRRAVRELQGPAGDHAHRTAGGGRGARGAFTCTRAGRR